MRPTFLCLALIILLPLAHARAIPAFRTAAAARAWAEAQERAGHYESAAEAYEREARLRRATGDPQGADVEHRRARRLATDLALAVLGPIPPPHRLAKFEPAAGCYLGVLDGDGGSADDFEERAGRRLALAFEYDAYGRPFPVTWARHQAEQGRAIQIAWEPNDIAAVRDDDYLEGWAEDAARAEVPIFLRFGGEMNGAWTPWGRDPAAYRRAFRTVHDVMARRAPNVAMVWAPNDIPLDNLDRYFPGDDVVDWVGLSLYIVRFYDDDPRRPAWQDHPLTFIEPFYQKYAARHPLCLVEWGVTRRSRVEGVDADPFAAARIEDLFDAIKVRFPRLKMACAFARNNLTGGRDGRRLNDYSLPPGSLALDSYRQAASDSYFLTEVSVPFGGGSPYAYQRLTRRLPPRYAGPVAVSLSTYALNPTLSLSRPGLARRLSRPYGFALPPGHGPLTVRVQDPQGRVAQTVSLAE
ncbi:MAG: hypothetical protein JO250_22950 [Armatimonadetes bacterium]|nr:hypothetical protein [Armatimonadota bacterium]